MHTVFSLWVEYSPHWDTAVLLNPIVKLCIFRLIFRLKIMLPPLASFPQKRSKPIQGDFSDSIICNKRYIGIKWGSSACIDKFIASSNTGEYNYLMLKIFSHENRHITFSRDSHVPLKSLPLQFVFVPVITQQPQSTGSEPAKVTIGGKEVEEKL